jgi:hypothetical protein
VGREDVPPNEPNPKQFYLVVPKWLRPLHAVQKGFGKRDLVFGQIRVFSIASGVILKQNKKPKQTNSSMYELMSSLRLQFTSQFGSSIPNIDNNSFIVALPGPVWSMRAAGCEENPSNSARVLLRVVRRSGSCSIRSGPRNFVLSP